MDFLFEHRSVRKYKPDPVHDGLVRRIIEAGTRASTTGNMQLYSVVVSRNAARRALLAPLHFNQAHVIQAPVLLTICADVNRFHRWCEARQANASYKNMLWLINAIIDAALFAQNICIAAETQGLGICYLGTALYKGREIAEILRLPAGVIPITAITLGYPDGYPELSDRLPLEAIMHDEAYNDYSDQRINDIYKEKEELESSKQFVKENNKQNLAQVFTDVRYTEANNVAVAEALRKLLSEQKFQI